MPLVSASFLTRVMSPTASRMVTDLVSSVAFALFMSYIVHTHQAVCRERNAAKKARQSWTDRAHQLRLVRGKVDRPPPLELHRAISLAWSSSRASRISADSIAW